MDHDPKKWHIKALEAIRPIFIDFGNGRLRHPKETDREWLYTRWLEGEPTYVEGGVIDVMRCASSKPCQIHGSSCWPEPMPERGFRPFEWTLPLDEAYIFKSASEEEQLVIDLWTAVIGCFWGTWDKPYPRTIPELNELLNTVELDDEDDATLIENRISSFMSRSRLITQANRAPMPEAEGSLCRQSPRSSTLTEPELMPDLNFDLNDLEGALSSSPEF